MATPNSEIIDRAIQVIIRLQDASCATLRHTLRIDQATAEAVLDGLEDSGIVTAPNAHGARDLSTGWKVPRMLLHTRHSIEEGVTA